MTDTHPLVLLWFRVALGFYAFALVAFDNGAYSPLLYVAGAALTLSYAAYTAATMRVPKFPPALLAYAALVAFAAASILWSTHPEFSAGRARTIAFILLNIVVVYNVIVRFRNPVAFFVGLYAGIVLNLAMALGVVDLGDLGLDNATVRFGGTVNQPNLIGYICAAALFGVFLHVRSVPSRRTKAANRMLEIVGLFALAAVTLFVVFLTGSRAALAVCLPLAIWIALGSFVRPLLAAPMAVALGAAIFLFGAVDTNELQLGGGVDFSELSEVVLGRIEGSATDLDDSVDERSELARAAYNLFQNQPLVGNGLATFEAEYGMYSHNNYLDVLSSVGVIGMLLMALVYVLIAKDLMRLNSIRLTLFFAFFLASQMFFDLALVTFSHKFQMLMPFVMLACMRILIETRSESLFAADDALAYGEPRRRRRRRRRMVKVAGSR